MPRYNDKNHPERDVYFTDVRLRNNEQIHLTLHYHTSTEKNVTHHRQPLTVSLCEMRRLGGKFHGILDELEDKLREARQHMKGNR